MLTRTMACKALENIRLDIGYMNIQPHTTRWSLSTKDLVYHFQWNIHVIIGKCINLEQQIYSLQKLRGRNGWFLKQAVYKNGLDLFVKLSSKLPLKAPSAQEPPVRSFILFPWLSSSTYASKWLLRTTRLISQQNFLELLISRWVSDYQPIRGHDININ